MIAHGNSSSNVAGFPRAEVGPMNPPVKLADLTEALDLMPEESGA